MAEPLPAFVARRKPDWAKLEATLEALKAKKLALTQVWELDALYRRVAADLALAQAQYPDTDVLRFLNQLSARAYASIYKPAGASFESISTFYLRTFPALVRAHLGPIKLSATLLFSAVVLGALAVVLQPDTANFFVGPELRQFIDRKDLWTDHALDSITPAEMASTIFLNNLRVLFTAFALGVTAAIGTVLVLLQNGVHVGALVATCFAGGVGPQILTFMCAHGPIELSLICISGGAGLHLGRALIDPGERSRGAAVRENATAAVQLVLGCAPFMVLIGIVEGFVSPGPFFPWPLKLAVGLLTGLGFWRWLLVPPRDAAPLPAPR